MRRLSYALCSAFVVLTVTALPALAKCAQEPIGVALKGSDSVWWATVTDAEPTKDHASQWRFTVEIVESLKGSGADGDKGVVFFSTCAPASPEPDRHAAKGYVDETMLFWGKDSDGTLVNPSVELTPELEQDALHERASSILGTDEPVEAAVIYDENWLSLSVVLALGFGVLLLVVGTLIAIVLRKRSRPA